MADVFYCNEHKVAFFKKGKMKGYAHPIGDTGQWCNMPEGHTETRELPEPKPTPQHSTAGVSPQDLPPIAGQTIGLTTKEIGDMIRATKLTELFGADAALELIGWYRGQILGNTRVKFDGAKLPTFKKVEK